MPKTPLFQPPSVPNLSDSLSTDASATFQNIASQTGDILVFQKMVEQYLAQILVQNIGDFVSLLIPQLLSNPDFQSGLADAVSGSSMGNIVNAINDPQNVDVKLALADYLNAYFGLTPTTPIEPIP